MPKSVPQELVFEKKLVMLQAYFPNFKFTDWDPNADEYLFEPKPGIFDKLDEYKRDIGGDYYLDIPMMAKNKLFAPLFPSSSPQLDWAYYNSSNKKTYIWNGTTWQVLTKNRKVGSIVWKGASKKAPANPCLNWAYYNSTDKAAYIWAKNGWRVIPGNRAKNSGVSIAWKGEMTSHPVKLTDIAEKYEKELVKKMNSHERPNIVEFFITRENDDKKFFNELNRRVNKLGGKYKLNSAKTLVDNFINEIYFCRYPESVGGKSKDRYWGFTDYKYRHTGSSIYKAFEYYTHSYCTLYLFGAEFTHLKECQNHWYRIKGKNGQTLPEYLSKKGDISKGLADNFSYINASDFIWRGGAEWDEEETKRYLLSRFELDIKSNINLKNICYSFCIPALYGLSATAYNEAGWDIIENTLLRELELARGKINRFPDIWEEKIECLLEGSYIKTKVTLFTEDEYINKKTKKMTYKKKHIKESIYYPTPFEKFIGQAAIQAPHITRRYIKIPETPTPEQLILLKKREGKFRDDVKVCFEEEFFGKKETTWVRWIANIKTEELEAFKYNLEAYLPKNGKLIKATTSNFFKQYLRAIDYIPIDREERQKIHSEFARKMKRIIDKLIDKGHWPWAKKWK